MTPRIFPRVASAVLLGGLFSAPAISCLTPSQVVVEVTLRGARCADIRNMSIAVGRATDSEAGLIGFPSDECKNGSLGSITAIPESGSDGGKIHIRVLVGVSTEVENCTLQNSYRGCVVARRRVTYRTRAVTRIPVHIDLSCENEACDVKTTCNRGRVCESADVDALCGGDACDLASEKPGAIVVTDGGADATIGDGGEPLADSSSDGAADSGSGPDPGNSGPGVVCGGVRCPVGQSCDTAGACVTTGGGTGYLHCDESSDCNMSAGERCCFFPQVQTGQCIATSACMGSDQFELCWKSDTCGSGAQCLSSVATASFGVRAACRRTSGPNAVACSGIDACSSSQVCRLDVNGAHSCAADMLFPRATCDSATDCAGRPCRLVREVSFLATTCVAGDEVAEVCDGTSGSCAAGKTCTTDTVEVAYGYRLRICR